MSRDYLFYEIERLQESIERNSFKGKIMEIKLNEDAYNQAIRGANELLKYSAHKYQKENDSFIYRDIKITKGVE